MEFRYLIKVNPEQPEVAVEALGLKVKGDAAKFSGIDLNFVKKQDFITAVPIEIALTMGMRAEVLFCNPECEFIVTGVPTVRVKKLVEYGYTVLAQVVEPKKEENQNPSEEKEYPKGLPVMREEDEEKKEEKPAVSGDGVAKPRMQNQYWFNGNRISKEEYEEKLADFKKTLADSGFGKDLLKSFLD